MKVIFWIINSILCLWFRIFGYKYKNTKCDTKVIITDIVSRKNWGSIQNGSKSVSIKSNLKEFTYGNSLYLKRQEIAGFNWIGEEIDLNYSGADISSSLIKIKEVEASLNWGNMNTDSWGSFWIYNDKSKAEIDYELYDGDRLVVTFHWIDKKNRKQQYSHTIPYIKINQYRIKTGKYCNKCYIGNKLVAIFPYPKEINYNVRFSMYAYKDTDNVDNSTFIYSVCKYR